MLKYANKIAGRIIPVAFALAATSALAQENRTPILAPDTPAPVPSTPSFFLFSDTQVSYRYQADTKQPGNASGPNDRDGRGAPKNILTISNANAWQYGTNFITIDFLKSGASDPAGYKFPIGAIATGEGALEYFGIYRGTLSMNAITGTKAFEIPGFVKDVSLAWGANVGQDNRAFRNDQRDALVGVNFSFDVPVGFVNLGIHAFKDFNHNGLVSVPYRTNVYDWTPEFEITYNIPLTFTQLPLAFAGFMTIIAPKGIDGFRNKTTTEFLSRSNLVLDIGKLLYNQPNRVDVFIGFEYWQNKFGNIQERVPGSNQKSFMAGVALHLN